MIRPFGRSAGSAALVVYALSAGAAFGQDVAAPQPVPDLTQPAQALETLSVSQRPHPELDPLGIRAGSFVVTPSLQVGEIYDSNIYGLRSGEISDYVTQIQPVVTIASDWNENSLAFYGKGNFLEYADRGSEDVSNMELQLSGRLDVLRGAYIEAWAGYQIQHEARYTPDSQAAAILAGSGTFALDPTEYNVETGHVAFVYAPRRIGLALNADVVALQFSNEPATNGGLVINSDRSRKEITITPRVSYEIVPGYQAFVQGLANWVDYDTPFDTSPQHLRRSSNGYGGEVGSQFNVSELITGEFFVGYQQQEYDDSRLPTTSGANFGGSILWNVTQLTSVKLVGSRSIGETILPGSSGYFDTRGAVTIEHELLRNLLLTGGVSYELSEYQGINRDDDDYGATVGGQWRFNRNFAVQVTGTWQQRDSNQGENNFGRETVMLSVIGQI